MAEKTATKKAEKQPVKRKVEFSNPYVLKTVSLNTTPAQLVYEAAFDECAVSMRNLSSVLPALIKDQSDMMAVNGSVEHLLNKAMADLRGESARIKKIADDNGIEMGKLNYTNALQVQARLTCNKAAQYLQIIVELDELICLVHSAWFAGFIADDAKSGLERQWRRKAIGVAAEIRSITNRAFRAHAKNTATEADDALHSEAAQALHSEALNSEASEEKAGEAVAVKPKRTKKAASTEPAEPVAS